jgi:hypothetical protein
LAALALAWLIALAEFLRPALLTDALLWPGASTRRAFARRIAAKAWLRRWPGLRAMPSSGQF